MCHIKVSISSLNIHFNYNHVYILMYVHDIILGLTNFRFKIV